MSHLLTKTRFVAGCQCHDLLWWQVHEPDAPELAVNISLEHRFEQGKHVAELARSYVPGGVLVEPSNTTLNDRILATQDALRAGAPVIYEASFMEGDVFVAVDVIERVNGGHNLIEVKSTTRVKDEHIPDVAVQVHVLRKAGIDVARAELMHLNSACRFPDMQDLFVRQDVTDAVSAVLPGVPDEIAAQQRMLEGTFPANGFGEQCLTGRECPFHDRCWPKLDEEHVLTLYRLKPAEKWDLLQRGIESIHDLPGDVRLNKQAERQVRAVKQGAMIVGPGMAEALSRFSGRLAHLDFETVSLAVPVWDGFGPWHQMPVQFSCHVETAPGQFAHHEYLATSGADCRAEMAEHLTAACDGVDRIVAYNASFERTCIRALAAAAPHLKTQLEEAAGKLIDPLPVVRDYVYHPGFMGQFGLKYVLPVLVPELGYDDLAITQGDVASLHLARLLFYPERVPEGERDGLRRHLLEYCKRDTMATVALVHKLRQLAGASRG